MGARIGNLDELTSILTNKEKMDSGILNFSKQFKLGRILRPLSDVKKQGKSLLSILISMILNRCQSMQ
jgi:hypothetical protein